jgi:hypothetical protein
LRADDSDGLVELDNIDKMIRLEAVVSAFGLYLGFLRTM